MSRRQRFASRREFLAATLAGTTAVALRSSATASEAVPPFPTYDKAQIAITLDLEMARNFPNWDDTHWDYEKGNLNQAAKDYTVAACNRVKERGGRIHTFVVGQVFEQDNVDWLKQIAADGHPIGNHTYDHIYLLAHSPAELQYRFSRAPWLIGGRELPDVIRENIALTNVALKERVGVEINGFRTPGGFATGLENREDIQNILLGLGFDWVSCRYPAHAGMEDLYGSGRKPSQLAFDEILRAQAESQPLRYPTGLIDVPMSPVSDIGAFRTGRWELASFLEAVEMGVNWAIENKAAFDFLAHPSCLGVVDGNFRAIDLICDLVAKSPDKAELVTLDAIVAKAKPQLAPEREPS
jgi:peptidoglycan/xylan/chitin deacetylase (PgdA/CDA1 family)